MLSAYSDKKSYDRSDFIIANGQMPNMATDKNGNVHIVYGTGDSLMYSCSSDNGMAFSAPFLISALPKVYSFATRGPQIAVTASGIIVTAATSTGNIFSFRKSTGGKWVSASRVNDVDTIAKEGLMALGADKENAFAAWLDLRGNKRNKIFGSRSTDGGKTWLKNQLIYASPDTTVCECCKPSVTVKGSNIAVMFRNWLKGNRDLYLVQSTDGGSTFGPAQKLGTGSWKLNGCPMDGGGLAINKDAIVQTVWRRGKNIYSAVPGMPEKEIGEGRGCTMETVNGRNVYAWVENGEVVVIQPQGEKKVVGKGSQPVIKALDNEHVICVWESAKQIHASILEL